MPSPLARDAFLKAVRDAGVVGEGGAGFPAHAKYAGTADTVIANACECEPLLHTDRHHMEHSAEQAMLALKQVAAACGARRVVFAMKRKHADLVPAIEASCRAHGTELALLDDFYPAGDEQVLVREVTGRSVPALGIPLAAGCLVANVGTLVSAYGAMRNVPVTHKTLTVTGEVRQPGILRAPVGTPMAECLAAAGGAATPDPVFILGGPMMGRLVDGPEALAAEHVAKTDGGLVVLPRGHALHRNAAQRVEHMRRRAACACIQCRFCSDLCPRALLGQPFETHRVMKAFGMGMELAGEAGRMAMLCSGCGVCEHYACPMGLSPRRINLAVRKAMSGSKTPYGGPTAPDEARTANRDVRKVPLGRLAMRLDVHRYMDLATPFLGTLEPSRVRIPLNRHIGAPAVPCIAPGQRVEEGACIGDIPEGALGARVHASLAGTVIAVDDGVTIRRQP
ncbi:MAG: SLBB domain-containing protein [Desulfovibrio sp.]|jgi:Na+-translocating ferredoxin:NAD+ oxidoreductase RnfC subunit|nr:SLBB domain-containing protein [Desulfovibrio sp.]